MSESLPIGLPADKAARALPRRAPPWKLCWSFCTLDCSFREAGECRRDIPTYDLPPPNEGVDHLCDLRFGLQDYDEQRTQYSRAVNRWYAEGQEGPKPTHWRKKVGDPYAGFRVWEDPERRVEGGYEQVRLYSPFDCQEFLITHPRIIQATHHAIEQKADYGSMRKLQAAAVQVFREFLSSGNPTIGDPKRALRFFEHAVDRIAQVLLVHYELYPMTWVPRIIEHANIDSPEWQGLMARVEKKLQQDAEVELATEQLLLAASEVPSPPQPYASPVKKYIEPAATDSDFQSTPDFRYEEAFTSSDVEIPIDPLAKKLRSLSYD